MTNADVRGEGPSALDNKPFQRLIDSLFWCKIGKMRLGETMQIVEPTSQPRGKSFDALAYVKHMEAVGFTRDQAVALAEEQNKLIDDRLATKTDILYLETRIVQTKSDLETKILQMKSELETKIAETKADLVKWVVGMSFAQVAMLVALLKLHI